MKGFIFSFQLGPAESGWSELPGWCTLAPDPSGPSEPAWDRVEVKSKGMTEGCQPPLSPAESAARFLKDQH